jgi:hypothetical protein
MTFWLYIFWSKNIRLTYIWPTLCFVNDAPMDATTISSMTRNLSVAKLGMMKQHEKLRIMG